MPLVGGHFFKAADPALVEDLQKRGVLLREQRYEHSYPHCWRCHTPLMYYAQPSWYIRTVEIKDQLLAENEKTNWYPESIKTGRYGDWLNNNVDWALSRDRYWGTPLPIWRNDADPTRLVAVGSLAELSELTGRDLSDLDPHRPFIDDVTFTLPGEEGTFRRVRQVIDAWYDSGSMPFAQWGAPHRNKEEFEAAYPAQFICEAIDQTRGWFYTLMAVGTLVFEKSSYENVLVPGPHPGRGRPEDEQAPGQHPRADPADGPARRRRRPLVHARRRLAVVGPPGRPRDAVRGRPEGAAHLLEHRELLHPLRRGQRLGPGRDARRRRAPSARCWTAGRWPSSPRSPTASPTRWRTSTPRAPAGCSPSSSTTCPTGTSAGPGAASGTATPPRWPRCTRCSTA